MTNRTTRTEAITLLCTLHDLRRLNQGSDAGTLARRLGWGMRRVYRVLGHLDAKQVADRDRCRLTMAGLALATAIRSERVRAHRAA